jgi:hypothetical protein
MTPEGYPDEVELETIRKWPWKDCVGLLEYVKERWWEPDWGWTEDNGIIDVSTGGWSGNEDLIGAMQDNTMFWMLCWESSRRGGHYEFTLPLPERSYLDTGQEVETERGREIRKTSDV